MTEFRNQGDIISKKKYQVVFGNHHLLSSDIEKMGPKWLDQVHGSTIVKASDSQVEADGHWTDRPNQALVIKTADCLPIFIFDLDRVFALHAGWRGVKKRIVTKALGMCREPHHAKIYIGPHIQMRSFQLDHESAQSLLNEHGLRISQAMQNSIALPSLSQKNHYHVSLSQLVAREAQSFKATPLYISSVDTFLSPYHNSYRRNRLNKKRNFSYIHLKG